MLPQGIPTGPELMKLEKSEPSNMHEFAFKALCGDPTVVRALEHSGSSRSIGQTGHRHLAIICRAFSKEETVRTPDSFTGY
jgi:hypothetical protein